MEEIKLVKPIIGLCAYSGSGKTTLLEKLIPIFRSYKFKIAVIKHAHHSFDIDYPNKDSYKIRKAGAQQILISSKNRWALIHENEPSHPELSIVDALKILDTKSIDFVIVEGFKNAPIPKIEIHRPELDKPLISDTDRHVIAIATDDGSIQSSLPILDLNNPPQIANFIKIFISQFSK